MNPISSHRGMKRKTIRKIIRDKLESVFRSIEDPEVRDIMKENVIVTGGSIASMLLGERINDFDLYLRTKDATTAVAEHYVKQFNELNQPDITPYVKFVEMRNLKNEMEDRVCIYVKSSGVASESDSPSDVEYQYFEQSDINGDGAEEYLNMIMSSTHGDKLSDEQADEEELPKYRPVFMSQNAITLKGSVQIIIRFYGEPQKIHDNYDFQHAMCSYDYHNDILDLPAEALESMMSKTLIYKGSLYPICSVFRTRKFIERGWKISAGQMLKMCWQISEIDLDDPVTIREQLTGVDAAYFHELIKVMEEERDLKVNAKNLDSVYIIQLIDKVFGE